MNPATLTTIVTVAAMVSFFTAIAQETKEVPKSAPTPEKTDRKFVNVGVTQFDQLLQTKTNIVLDVRTRQEYTEGHLPGAVLIDFTAPGFDREIAKLDKNKTYLVHCRVGARSARACKKMEQLGFKNLFNLDGGLLEWEKEGKPVEKQVPQDGEKPGGG